MIEQPTQPVYLDELGVERFRANAIVRYLLDEGPVDMNQLACLPFSDADRAQFAQLIGYSVGGFYELDYSHDDEDAHELDGPDEGERAEEAGGGGGDPAHQAGLLISEEGMRQIREAPDVWWNELDWFEKSAIKSTVETLLRVGSGSMRRLIKENQDCEDAEAFS